ncbi:hypothetical protein LV780_10230 [Cereibacter azotoformans]|uniref:CTP synthetase n=1 Tax=Cereibacter azotoformans TaxID=43057 RepID=A0A2T5KC45_9RHOB|nr:hypothetical protein [Cereibacter azotoformans]AXQ94143.1 hypothetical protein D0Z66_10245 [Cereibacter sphaeroides]MBO4168052.1 hypothetical protein [Cereibacter azotoformans]PTR19988.1 hypothetical protein C8J28_103114 [Cereibacter azotoformans]UIJ29678.1 hypothetical protein LV780_10230 [Cereibacter azotoformans]
MDRLSIILTLMTGAVITGGLVILFFTFGWYGWLPIAIGAVVGIVLSWPAGYVISRRIKRTDPQWDESRVERVESTVPKPDAPEV